jgi:hypothetical protein
MSASSANGSKVVKIATEVGEVSEVCKGSEVISATVYARTRE